MEEPKRIYTTILIKRRINGEAGPPPMLGKGELAFNETNKTLYIGSNIPTLSAAEEF
jgi:hypothetical protein